MKVVQIGWDRASEFVATVLGQPSLAAQPEALKAETAFLDWCRRRRSGNPSPYEWRGGEVWGVFDDGATLVGLQVARLGSSRGRPGAWGRYVNHYALYTRPECRGQGYGRAAAQELWERWAALYDRVKALAGSPGGWGVFAALGARPWGLTEAGELIIDEALPGHAEPAGVPPNVLRYDTDARLSDAELTAALTDPRGRFRLKVVAP